VKNVKQQSCNGNGSALMKIGNLKKFFPIKRGVFRRVVGYVRAVDDVNLTIRPGRTLGIVGESGSGKTTVGRSLLRLIEPTSGTLDYRFEGQDFTDILKLHGKGLKNYRKEAQIVFQNPYGALNPNLSIYEALDEPLKANGLRSRSERRDRIVQLLESVNLSPQYMYRYPHQFSGGQRQRIVLARSLSVNPKLLVCDEPVSALDVSVQTQVLLLLKQIQMEMNLTYLFIAHDLSVVEYMSDDIAVMYLGKIVEQLPAEKLIRNSLHPYTRALISSIPQCDPLQRNKPKNVVKGEVGDPSNPPPGCSFHPRCPFVTDICKVETPGMISFDDTGSHAVACHNYQSVIDR